MGLSFLNNEMLKEKKKNICISLSEIRTCKGVSAAYFSLGFFTFFSIMKSRREKSDLHHSEERQTVTL